MKMNSQSVECVMAYRHPVTRDFVLTPREFQIRSAHWSASTPLSPELIAQLRALPAIQQLALMQMHESQVSRAVAARLKQDAQARPDYRDYAGLRERGWCWRRPADRWHSLTRDGVTAAAHLEQILCRKLSIHLMLETGSDRYHVRFRCCCGDWQTESRKGDFTNSNAARAHRRHVEDVSSTRRLFDAPGSAGA